MTVNQFLKTYWAEILLAGILILSGFLNLWNLWNQGISNTYYAAAVRSMLENPNLIFFNSFDAGGFVTVDKPPVGLWVQIASAAVLGFSGWALVLPQALSGVCSVALTYAIVSRPFGKIAGLVSAFALAVTPIFVAVSRNGTMDGLLIFVLLLAVWVALKAARERSLPYLLLSIVLIGIGFNIKMIQAFIVVPAILAIYLLGADISIKKRIGHITLAFMLLIVVSLSWAMVVDRVPADERPYIGGSGDNTVLGLIINYNGMHRLENGMMQGAMESMSPNYGQMSGPIGGLGAPLGIVENRTGDHGMNRPTPGSMIAPSNPESMPVQNSTPPSGAGAPSFQDGRNGGGMMGDTGMPGVFRLFSEGLAGQISWLLPFALIGLFAWWRRPESFSVKSCGDAGLFGEKGLTLLAMCLWLLPGLLYFSFTTGFWHTYYLATIAPPLAALVGIGAVKMYWDYPNEGRQGWLLVAAVAITGVVHVLFLLYTPDWSGILIPVVLCGTIAVLIGLGVLKIYPITGTGMIQKRVALIAVALLFIAPVVWSSTPFAYGNNGILPFAGPQLERGVGGMGPGNSIPGTTSGTLNLATYLLSHTTNETWIVAVASANNEGANLIIETGKPVMALGGFSGIDQILSVDSVKELIQNGRVRYFLTSASGGGSIGSGNSEILTWVSSHCAVVPSSEWGGNRIAIAPVAVNFMPVGSGIINVPLPDTSYALSGQDGNRTGMSNQNTLYDCAGFSKQAASM
ncbi:MAG: glycosyltransferase family 39 protein [Methanoregula sp.]|jgi:4-amino-4-deoxy-L-arabinose transferase-like glycosyltransferase